MPVRVKSKRAYVIVVPYVNSDNELSIRVYGSSTDRAKTNSIEKAIRFSGYQLCDITIERLSEIAKENGYLRLYDAIPAAVSLYGTADTFTAYIKELNAYDFLKKYADCLPETAYVTFVEMSALAKKTVSAANFSGLPASELNTELTSQICELRNVNYEIERLSQKLSELRDYRETLTNNVDYLEKKQLKFGKCIRDYFLQPRYVG